MGTTLDKYIAQNLGKAQEKSTPAGSAGGLKKTSPVLQKYIDKNLGKPAEPAKNTSLKPTVKPTITPTPVPSDLFNIRQPQVANSTPAMADNPQSFGDQVLNSPPVKAVGDFLFPDKPTTSVIRNFPQAYVDTTKKFIKGAEKMVEETPILGVKPAFAPKDEANLQAMKKDIETKPTPNPITHPLNFVSSNQYLKKENIFSTNVVKGATANVLKPKSPEPKTFADKLVGDVGNVIGSVAALKFIGGKVSALAGGSETLGAALSKYPTVAKYALPFAEGAATFDIYGQLDPDTENRFKKLAQDTLLSVPYTALGFAKSAKMSVPAAFGLGFGMAKLSGADNEEAFIQGAILATLDVSGRWQKSTVENAVKNESIAVLNELAGTKLKNNATPEQIKAAYRKAAQIHHPDKGGSEANMARANAAYSFLNPKTNAGEATFMRPTAADKFAQPADTSVVRTQKLNGKGTFGNLGQAALTARPEQAKLGQGTGKTEVPPQDTPQAEFQMIDPKVQKNLDKLNTELTKLTADKKALFRGLPTTKKAADIRSLNQQIEQKKQQIADIEKNRFAKTGQVATPKSAESAPLELPGPTAPVEPLRLNENSVANLKNIVEQLPNHNPADHTINGQQIELSLPTAEGGKVKVPAILDKTAPDIAQQEIVDHIQMKAQEHYAEKSKPNMRLQRGSTKLPEIKKELLPLNVKPKNEVLKREKPVINKKIELTTGTKPEDEARAQHEYEILSGLENAQAGYRYTIEQEGMGGTKKTVGVSSTFPDWIPEGLRSKKLIDATIKHIYDGTLPTKANEVRLYNEIKSEIDSIDEGKALAESQIKQEINIDDIFKDPVKSEAIIDKLIQSNLEQYDNLGKEKSSTAERSAAPSESKAEVKKGEQEIVKDTSNTGSIEPGDSNYYDSLSNQKGENLPVREIGDLYKSPLKLKFKKNGYFNFAKEKISSPADVAYAFRQLKNEAVEKFYVVAMKGDKPVAIECVSVGTINASLVHPREVSGLLINKKADGAYFVHNHPSGNPEPSQDDIEVSKRLIKVLADTGIKYRGHVVIDTTKFGSIDENWQVSLHDQSLEVKAPTKVASYSKYVEWSQDKGYVSKFTITQPKDIYSLVKGLNIDEKNNALVMYLDSRNSVIAAEAVPTKSLSAANDKLLRNAVLNNSAQVAIGNFPDDSYLYKILSNKFRQLGIELIDGVKIDNHSTGEFTSFREYLGEKKTNYNVPTTGENKNLKSIVEANKVADSHALEKKSPESKRLELSGKASTVSTKVPVPVEFQDNFINWKDKGALSLNRETMERNLDSVAGEQAPLVKSFLTDPVLVNETARTAFVDKIRNQTQKFIVKELGIKPKSKESALVQQYGEKRISLDELKAKIKNWENIAKAADYFRKEYDGMLDMWNEQRTKYGYEPVPKREDYFRHGQFISEIQKQFGMVMGENDLPTSISGMSYMFKPGTPFSTAALKRLGGEFTDDAVTGFDEYINATSRSIFHTDSLQRGRSLEKVIRKTAEENPDINLPNFTANLAEYNNLIGGKKSMFDRSFESMFGRKVYSVVNFLKNRTGANMIGANVSSALTNFIPTTQLLAVTPKIDVAHGLSDVPSLNPVMIDGLTSGFLQRRFYKQEIHPSGWQKTNAAFNVMFKAVDLFTSRMVVASRYRLYQRKGYDSKQAMQKADLDAAHIVTDRSIGQLPNIFGSKTLGMFTQFQTEVNNQWSFIMKDMPKMSEKSKFRLGNFVIQYALFSYIFNNLYEKFIGRRPTLDPIHAIATIAGAADSSGKDGLAKRTGTAAKDIIDNMPFVSTFTGGRIPISTGFPDVASLYQGKTTLGKELIKPVLFFAFPMGGNQLKKTLNGVTNYNEGGVYTPAGSLRYPIEQDTGNRIRTTLFGASGAREAKDYYNAGDQPLSKKQSAIFDNLKKNDSVKARAYYDRIQNTRDAKAELKAAAQNE